MTAPGGALRAHEFTGVGLDPLRDSRHRSARAARELADWLAEREAGKTAARTLDSYERTCAALLRAFPDTAFSEFTPGDIVQLLITFPERSRHINRSALNSWFKWGYVTRLIDSNPVDRVTTIRYKPNRIYDTYSAAETDALCALPFPDGQLMTLMLWTGLRRAEARYLTAKRLDANNRQVLVIDGAKGSKSRVVPMIARVQAAAGELLTLEGLGPDDYLWYDRPGGRARLKRRTQPISDSSFGRWYANSVNKADVPYRKPHMTRHSFATRMRELGLPMEEIQVLLGHESIATTSDIYVNTNLGAVADHMREAVGDLV